MQISEIIRLVCINIKQNRFKVFLTSLGIIVGTATIVMVIAIGEGGKADVAEQYKTLNAGTITVSASTDSMMAGVMPGMMPSGGGGGGGTRSSGGSSTSSVRVMSTNESVLEESNLEDILFFVPDITTGAIFASAEQSVTGGDLEEAEEYDIIGTQSSMAQISNLSLAVGTFITDDDVEQVAKAVVLGYNIAIEMFGSAQDAYDSQIEIDGRKYVVNGVLNAVGTVVSGVSPDTTIYMPYSTAEKYVFERNTSPQISIMAVDVGVVEEVMGNIELVLKQSNPNGMFTVTDAGATMDAAMESANTLSMLLLAVAVIVFIVGGIGIMNVLFVSVKERTKEIGVLKAIGTKKWNILMLFLVEANAIGVIGGVIGILASLAIIPLMAYTEITVILTIPAVILALLFAVVTGTVFGFYPAWKASNLVPIQALNNE